MDLTKSLPNFIAELRDIEKRGGRLNGNALNDLSATLKSQQRDPLRGSDSFATSSATPLRSSRSQTTSAASARREERFIPVNTLHELLTTSVSASPSRTCLTFDEDEASIEVGTTLIDIPPLPQHIDHFKKQYEKLYDKRIKLPLIRQLSPRSQRKITQLPAPTEYDLTRAASLEKLATKKDTPKFYSKISHISSKHRLEALRDGSAIPSVNSNIDRLLSQKSFHASDTPIAVGTESTNYFRSVVERKHRKQVQIANMASVDSASVVSGDGTSLLRSNTPGNHRPHSPDIYPFQTALTEYLGHHNSSPKLTRSDSLASNVSHLTDVEHPVSVQRAELTDIQKAYQPIFNEAAAVATKLASTYDKIQEVKHEEKKKAKSMNRDHLKFLDTWKTSIIEGLGVTVDAKFTYERKFGHALRVLFFYVYLGTMRISLRRWIQFKIMANAHRKYRAALTLTRVGRGMLGRMQVREIRENIRKQREAEERFERQRQALRSYKARRIAMCWKRHKQYQRRKYREMRNRAATTIQRHVRGVQGRAYAMWYRHYLARKLHSTIVIQSSWRMYKAKRRVRLLLKLDRVGRYFAQLQHQHDMKSLEYRMSGASFCIARAYRTHVIRCRLATLLFWHRTEKAGLIQRNYRGHAVRLQFHAMLKVKAAIAAKRNDAATRIQTAYRRYIAMKKYAVHMEYKEVARKERLKRKKRLLKDKKLKFGGGKSINFSKMNRGIRSGLRSLMPFRYVFERNRALTIQRVFRGHRARRRFLVLLVHQKIHDVMERKSRRERAAVDIQRVYRGSLYRYVQLYTILCLIICSRKMRKDLWRRKAILIQCYWRRRAARQTVFLMKQKIRAMEILNETLSAIVVGMKYRKLRKLEKMYSRNVKMIQRLARRYLGRQRRRAIKDAKRLRADGDASAQLTTMKLLAQTELMVLYESLSRPIGVKAPVLCGVQCPCFGPVQSLFVGILGKKGKADPDLLVSNRIDTSTVQRLMSQAEELFFDKKAAKKEKEGELTLAQIATAKKLARKARQLEENFVFVASFETIKLGIVQLPKVSTKIASPDVDVMFNKYKGSSGGSVMTYAEFCEFLKGVGQFSYVKYPEVMPLPSASAAADDDDFDDSNKSTTSKKAGFKPPLIRRTSSFQTKAKKVVKKSMSTLDVKTLRSKYILPSRALLERSDFAGVCVVVQVLMAMRKEEWLRETYEWIAKEGHARASVFVLPIQCMVRCKLARVRAQYMRDLRDKKNANSRENRAAIRMQALILRFVQRQRAVKLAQKTIIKYIPATGAAYWYHPQTRISSYTKPKVLGSYDCLEIPLPLPKQEYIVRCCNCNRSAEVNCRECEDSMCNICFQSLHCKGKRKQHTPVAIPFCSMCKFQMACKSCTTCSLRRPPRRSAEELITGDRGQLCDGCYCYLHNKLSGNRLDSSVNTVLKNASLMVQNMHQRIDTDHRYVSLVQTCEECQWRSACWRCRDCDQVYCNLCLLGLHSIGGIFSKHKAEALPYYTPEMHSKFERASFDQRLQKRIEKITQAYTKRMQVVKMKSIIKIQAWWRGILGKRVGKEYMKKRRKEIRRKYRLRKYEDREIRSAWSYRLLNIFGYAPALRSDTMEESVLQRHSVFSRQGIRRYIWKNVDDWGYYKFSEATAPESVPMRKGVPKRGFDVGTLSELQEQAKYGGYRLPGRVKMKFGETTHELSMDITPLVKKGSYLRIGISLFAVLKIKENKIILNRKWRFLDAEKVMYLLPSLPGEKYRLYYKIRHDSYDYVVGNVVVQRSLKWYESGMNAIATYATNQSNYKKRRGLLPDAKKWTAIADTYHRRAHWANFLMYDGGGPVEVPRGDDESVATAGSGPVVVERSPDKPWMPNEHEREERRLKDMKMSRDELAADAVNWAEKIDPLKNTSFFVYVPTGEMSYDTPKAVMVKREMEAEQEIKRKQFAETQKKIARMAAATKKKR